MATGIVMVTGGARSGKSRIAEEIAGGPEAPVLYVATAAPGDEEMRARIACHRARRPTAWRTVEEQIDLAGALGGERGRAAAIIDCLTVWLSNLLTERDAAWEVLSEEQAFAKIEPALGETLAAAEAFPGRVVLVSNELGGGVVPETPRGRLFRDLAGRMNQEVAAAADELILAVAGLPLRVK